VITWGSKRIRNCTPQSLIPPPFHVITIFVGGRYPINSFEKEPEWKKSSTN
jgi:hypothetical protein